MDHAHPPPLAQVPKPQATVLALGSRGRVLARSWALTAVRVCWATWRHRTEDAVRQQWRECCSEATAKRGTARQALGVETCWVPRWAWGGEQGEGPPWALALDATTVGPRFSGWARSGGYRGGAIPGAGTALAATANQAWRRQGWRMRRQGHRALPRPSTVMGLAERGVALLDHAPLPMGRVVPEPWPTIPVEEEAPPSWPERALPQAAGGRRPQARQGHA
jgi:hypothetical protein